MVQPAHPHPLAEGDPVGEVEAMEEAAEVGAEGGGVEAEGLGDFFVAPAAGDSQGHGPLAGGEAPPGIPSGSIIPRTGVFRAAARKMGEKSRSFVRCSGLGGAPAGKPYPAAEVGRGGGFKDHRASAPSGQVAWSCRRWTLWLRTARHRSLDLPGALGTFMPFTMQVHTGSIRCALCGDFAG